MNPPTGLSVASRLGVADLRCEAASDCDVGTEDINDCLLTPLLAKPTHYRLFPKYAHLLGFNVDAATSCVVVGGAGVQATSSVAAQARVFAIEIVAALNAEGSLQTSHYPDFISANSSFVIHI